MSTVATLRHAAALCLVAGFVDAVGYFQFGHVFTANMTGNTVLLGASLVRLQPVAATYVATLALFCIGAACAVLLKTRRGGLGTPLSLVAAIVAAAGLIPMPNGLVLLALAFAMGVQGGTITAFSGIRLPTVVVTSTLVNLVEGLVTRAGWAGDDSKPPAGGHLWHYAAAWLAYGAGGGAAVLAEGLSVPLLAPALVCLLVALDLARLART